SLIHLSRTSVVGALREVRRVLQPNGRFLAAVHGGEGELHVDEFLGMPASIDATLFQPEEMAQYLRQAGLASEIIVWRPPYDFDFQTTRVCVRAPRPPLEENP